MLTIPNLVKRMKLIANGKECGINFLDDDKIELWWELSLTQKYCFTVKMRNVSVECNDFQRAMFKAQNDLKG